MEDKVLQFFPNEAPANPHPWLAEMTIRDLLRMATCFEEGTNYDGNDPDWIKTFFTGEITHKAGQIFRYCTTGTTMLCVIIRRISGEEFMTVLRPVFDKLGISEDAFCVETPCGYEWGGSGVCLTAREFAVFADLCTHYGAYGGEQLLPRDYMIEATSKQIDSSWDSGAGYGYQFWILQRGFAMRGMGGQFAICLPELDITLITNAYDDRNYEKFLESVFPLFFSEIVPALCDHALPEEEKAIQSLVTLTGNLRLPMPPGLPHVSTELQVDDKTYVMETNPLGILWLRFTFTEDGGTLHYENATGVHALKFGYYDYIQQPFPETHYSGRRIGTPCGYGYDSLTAAAWTMPNTLRLYCQIIDIYHGNLRIQFAFEGDAVTLLAEKNAEWFLEEYKGFANGRLLKGGSYDL